MDRTKAAELLTKALRCVQTDHRNCGECKKCENYATKEDGIEALGMAISALKQAPTALDHIHNVVRDDAYRRGYEQGKADANCPEIPDSWIPVSERLPKSNPEDLEYPTVIICLKDGTVELGCFYESTKEWGTGEDFDRLVNPVAWMPLPEPYKEGGQHGAD